MSAEETALFGILLLSALGLGLILLVLLWGICRYHLLEQYACDQSMAAGFRFQETIRQKSAAALHSEIAPLLALAKLQLHQFLNNPSAPTMEKWQEPIKHLDTATRQLSRISDTLYPLGLEYAGLEHTLRSLVGGLDQEPKATLVLQDLPSLWKKGTELMVFRVVEALLHNTLQHAQAGSLHLSLQVNKSAFQIQLRDDGRGFDPVEPYGKRKGLYLVVSRVRVLRGTVDIRSAPDKGTHCFIIIPLRSLIPSTHDQ